MDRHAPTKPKVKPGQEPFRRLLEQGGVALFDGAMGTMFYSRGVFINRAFEELNLTRPSLVREVHAEYLAAGADVLETNTYMANRFRLSAHGLSDRVEEINTRAVEIAREAGSGAHWVAGAIGPLGVRIEPFGPISREEARAVFAEQARALAAAGVDLFVIETFSNLSELQQAIFAVREVSDLPLIAQMTVGKGGVTPEGVDAGEAAAKLVAAEADVVGVNCSEALATLDALEAMRKAVDAPLSGQPNAGQPRTVQGRHLYLASPDYLVAWARRALRVGARVLGGCCGTTPDHIRMLCQAVRETEPVTPPASVGRAIEIAPAAEPPSRKERSVLAGALASSRFVVGAEMPLPIGWETSGIVAAARRLAAAGASFLALPEDSRSEARMPPYAMAQLLAPVRGIEPVVYYACRERRLARIQSDLLGVWASGLANLLLVTGEPPHSPLDAGGSELDVDAIGAVNLASRLNHGEDIGGNPIGKPTGFHIGVRLDPTSYDREQEVRRLYWKVDAGAEYALTSPVFDLDALQSLVADTREFKIPIIATVWPLRSAREAEFFEHEMVDVPVPKTIVERMQRAERDGTEAREGVAIARELTVGVRDLVHGLQVYVPGGRLETALEVLEAL
ncbi:MAG TPA: bifunctional homocysteine S-methyltransferase/methylenetetrahydrofolate reductase [Candidatus Polarisedimenticolaceae bacterium]|nr:bifunctional homocysteine S-methyltransferase/methylenetetrahydrofolate reductase [Candidatus Polarisedimenticolaceae bacterium]